MNDKFEKALAAQLGPVYLTQKELTYSVSAGIFLTPYEYSKYLDYKDELIDHGDDRFIDLPLKSFNSKHIYLSIGEDLNSLINSYLDLLVDDYDQNKVFIKDRFAQSLNKSRMYSEIEGSLNVEAVPTTRRRLKELLEDNKKPETANDIIIKNMHTAIKYVEKMPLFNKDNLLELYNILSDGCLSEDNKLMPGNYYRHDTVEIGGYHGCPYTQIEECMDSLFDFVNGVLNTTDKTIRMFIPHICHYYLLYIHPYFDYNGRTARMVSYWVYLLTNQKYHPPVISEAINQTKGLYYKAIEMTRDAHNDLSFFLKYIFSLTCDYILCYKNLEHIEQLLKNKSILLTETDSNYIKKIMITYQGKFAYMDFLNNCNVEMTKQGALKTLNKLVEYGFLEVVETPSKNKLFDINKKIIKYRISGKMMYD